MRTTVALDVVTRDRLLALKAIWREKSLEAVIDRLLGGAPAGAKALYESHRADVDAVLRRHRVKRLVAFGSRARGDARPESDLDLVAELPPRASLFDLGRLREELEEAFGLPVDVLSSRAVTARVKRRVAAEGVVLVE